MKTIVLILAQFILANGGSPRSNRRDRLPHLPSSERLIVAPRVWSMSRGDRPANRISG